MRDDCNWATDVYCDVCRSTGECSTCEGEGVLPVQPKGEFDRRLVEGRCEDCAGSGECPYCFEERMR